MAGRKVEEVTWECEVPQRKAKLGGTSECRAEAIKEQPDNLVAFIKGRSRDEEKQVGRGQIVKMGVLSRQLFCVTSSQDPVLTLPDEAEGRQDDRSP